MHGFHYDYFKACVGVWRCPIDIQVTGARLLRQQMGIGSVIAFWFMSIWPRWLGCFYLETTVAIDSNEDIHHTTTVRWLGLPLVRTAERMLLHDDGQNFSISGVGRSATAPWRKRDVTGSGKIAPCATRAHYEVNWMGSPLKQGAFLDGDSVTLTQDGSGFYGVQSLRRRRQIP